jgi:regulator of PEP synthase PpsR (kinase-PPPase family)
MRSAPLSGQYHGLEDQNGYNTRIHAVHYALENDDGAILRNYGFADLILVGVSRSGKTPTCLYLGLQHGVMAANYPLTEDELPDGQLPEVLLPHRDKLFALTLQPQQLARIRQQRRPNSRYATLDLCRWELAQAEALFARYQIPTIDTTARSIEEIATRLLQHLGLVARMPR